MKPKLLSFKIPAGILMIAILAVLTTGSLFIALFRDAAFETKKQAMLVRAQSIAEATAPYLGPNGSMRGYGMFSRLLDSMADAKVWITDSQGAVLLESQTGDASLEQHQHGMGEAHGMTASSNVLNEHPSTLTQDALQSIRQKQPSISEDFSEFYHEPTLTVGVPVVSSTGEVVGGVFLHAPITGINDSVQRAGILLLIGMGGASLFALILGIIFSRQLVTPLKTLTEASAALAAGNYDAIAPVSREDEIGQLNNTFSNMASTLSQTLEQLHQEKNKLSNIIESISEGIFAFDRECRLIQMNPASQQWLRILWPKGCQKPWGSTPESESIHPLLIQALEQGTPLKTILPQEEETFLLEINPVVSQTGDILGAVMLLRDISESESLERLRREFVSNVSHELRTPLTVIKGSLEALLDGTVTDPPTVDQFYRHALEETRIMEKLVGELLDLSKLDADTWTLNNELLDAKSLGEDALQLIGPIAQEQHMQIHLECPGNLPPLPGDYDRLRQALIIFLENGIKYGDPNSPLTLRIEHQEALWFHVENRGIGLRPEEIPKIWDRFYRAPQARTKPGSGLGLSIAKRIIDRHGGTATALTTAEGITRFSMGIPIH